MNQYEGSQNPTLFCLHQQDPAWRRWFFLPVLRRSSSCAEYTHWVSIQVVAGSIFVHGSIDGNVKEEAGGNLIIGPTGTIDGHARESGEGSLANDGWVSGRVTED